MEKKTLSWEEFDDLATQLAGKISAAGFQPDFLIGIARGGLVPLAIIAEQIGTKDVASVSARSYDQTTKGDFDITALPEIDLTGKSVLLIDEITDTGETIQKIAELIMERYKPKEVKTAVVVVNNVNCKHWPDFYITETDEWIVFPWQEWPRRKRVEK
jgi:hypoxanthine phosphoribosyltransferase